MNDSCVKSRLERLLSLSILRRLRLQGRWSHFREFGAYLKKVVPYPVEIVERLNDE
jgi:hypothetical protein